MVWLATEAHPAPARLSFLDGDEGSKGPAAALIEGVVSDPSHVRLEGAVGAEAKCALLDCDDPPTRIQRFQSRIST